MSGRCCATGFRSSERANGSRTRIVTGFPLAGTDVSFHSSIDVSYWTDYSVQRLDSWQLPQHQATPSPGGIALAPNASSRAQALARRLNDILLTINELRLTAEQRPSGLVALRLDHNMIELSALQVKRPWSDRLGAGRCRLRLLPGRQTWRFRAAGVLAKISNTVLATIS